MRRKSNVSIKLAAIRARTIVPASYCCNVSYFWVTWKQWLVILDQAYSCHYFLSFIMVITYNLITLLNYGLIPWCITSNYVKKTTYTKDKCKIHNYQLPILLLPVEESPCYHFEYPWSTQSSCQQSVVNMSLLSQSELPSFFCLMHWLLIAGGSGWGNSVEDMYKQQKPNE